MAERISIPITEHDSSGIGNLDEAVELARVQGIVNASGAISQEAINDHSVTGVLAGLGLLHKIEGVSEIHRSGGVTINHLAFEAVQPDIQRLILGVEDKVAVSAGDHLPDWRPSGSSNGLRMIGMSPGAKFRNHPDIYEGLVVSIQLAVNGEKVMKSFIENSVQHTPIVAGDVTLFACDGFSKNSRRVHGFAFDGVGAAAITMGQDPYYTITGKYPMVDFLKDKGIL